MAKAVRMNWAGHVRSTQRGIGKICKRKCIS